jgi:hypothetical protein
LKHHLGYEERWKMPETSKALEIGGLFHKAMEVYLQCLQDEAGVFDSLRGRRWAGLTRALQLVRDAETKVEYEDLLLWMLEGYDEHYAGDPHWEIIGVELPLEGWMYNRAGNRTGYRMKGKIDVLVRDLSMGGGLWIVDHKTCGNLPKEKDYDWDDQSAIYTMLGRRNGMDIRGTIFDAVRTKKLVRAMTMEERFKRVITTRTDAELRTMEIEAHETFVGRIKASKNVTLGGGVMPPRNPDPDRCGWRCNYTEACLMSRKGGDIRDFLSAVGGVQDPTRH